MPLSVEGNREQQAEHSVARYLKHDLPVTANTDRRTASNITLPREYQKLVQQFDWGLEQMQCTVQTATATAFIDQQEKAGLRGVILDRWPKP